MKTTVTWATEILCLFQKPKNLGWENLKWLVVLLILTGSFSKSYSTGEASTYFNIYVSPNNESTNKDVGLIVTAINDSTWFHIEDTNEDGDNDDTVTGILMAGQSYVLYMRNGDINDDAPHAGDTTAKQDGDHFIITSNKLIVVAQSTNSDWQHEWLPATNKTSKGKKFYFYSNKSTNSANDINVMAFEDSTAVTIKKISTTPTLSQGYTDIDLKQNNIIINRMLNVGEDFIYSNTDGRDALEQGETYLIESNKDITVQYGALYGNEQDAGGYVPASNGSSLGDLFYFAVPFQDSAQQEIRIVSWSNYNDVTLEYYDNGQWVSLNTFTGMAARETAEWVGKNRHETYATIFKASCTPGKKISVLEANWIETGAMRTSDLATMATSNTGAAAGNTFLVYMPIPCAQGNITNPATGNKLPAKATHAYIFGNRTGWSQVSVKDISTQGSIINRTYTIMPNGYVDCMLDSAQWVSIYNGTGNAADGPQRPYLQIQASTSVAVMLANTNDNWTMYYGSSMGQNVRVESSTTSSDYNDDDTITVESRIKLDDKSCQNACMQQNSCDGLKVAKSSFIDSTSGYSSNGNCSYDPNSGRSYVSFPTDSTLDTTHTYIIRTVLVPQPQLHDGTLLPLNTVLSLETNISGSTGGFIEQASTSLGIVLHTHSLATQVTSVPENKTAIWSWGNEIFITSYKNSSLTSKCQVIVTDLTGRTIFSDEITSGSFYSKQLNSIATQYLLVSVVQNNQVTSKKVLITNP